MRFVHIADVHLGAQPDRGRPYSARRGEELWEAFRRVIGEADRQQADFLFIAGDLFHRQPSRQEVSRVRDWLGELRRTQVVMAAGNHDYLAPGTAYQRTEWPDHVWLIDSAQVGRRKFLCGRTPVYVYGCSYVGRENLEPVYDSLEPGREPGIHILLAHGGDARHIPMDYGKIGRAGFHYVAMGHIHRPHIFSSQMAYAGALEPIDRLDTGPHGYIEGEIDESAQPGEGTRLRFAEAASRSYIPVELACRPGVGTGELLRTLRGRIQELGRDNLYSVCLRGTFRPGMRPDAGLLLEEEAVCAVEDRSRADWDMEKLWRESRGQLLGEFLEGFRGRELSLEEEAAREYGVEALLETSGGRR